MRVDFSKKYAEGTFSKDGFTTARPAFKKFMAELEKTLGESAVETN